MHKEGVQHHPKVSFPGRAIFTFPLAATSLKAINIALKQHPKLLITI